MDAKAILDLFQPLWTDVKPEDQITHKPLKFAHYTTMATLEKIVSTNELWFSNPLYMNDLEEVRFGIINGLNELHRSKEVEAAFGDPGLARLFHLALDDMLQTFESQHLIDTYIVWPAAGFEDTEFGVFMEPGGGSWQEGSTQGSSRLKLFG